MSVVCEKCQMELIVGMWPFCPHGILHPQAAQHFDPVVYHMNAKGELRFPGATDAPVPDGYQKRELKTIGEVRAFQARVTGIENAKIRQQVEEECAWLETVEHANRAELHQRMASMSPMGRAFAEIAMQIHNARRPTSGDAGFYLESFEMDATNREAYRDERTQWRRKRG